MVELRYFNEITEQDLHKIEYAVAPDWCKGSAKLPFPFLRKPLEKEAAETFGISVSTLKREWEFVRAWLYKRLK